MRPKVVLRRRTVLAVIGVSLVSLITLEGSVRILSTYSYGVKRLTFYRYDNVLPNNINSLESLLSSAPFPMAPATNEGGFILNSRGLRTPEYEVTKAPGTTRIVGIGDSFMFSSGHVPYPQHFTVVLQERLETWLGKSVEMINLGIPSVGPRYEQRMLEVEGVRLNPDLVIWAFFVGNDFVEEIPLSASGASVKQRVLMNCHLCRVVRNAYILLSYTQSPASPETAPPRGGPAGTYVGSPDDYDPTNPTLPRSSFIEIQSNLSGIYAPETFPWDSWLSIQQTMIDVRDLGRQLGIPILVVIIPAEIQVDDELLGEVVGGMGRTVEDFEMDSPQRLLTQFFRTNDMPYCDLLSVFREMQEEAILYHAQDTHWNSAGNELAGQAIFDCLVQSEDGILQTN